MKIKGIINQGGNMNAKQAIDAIRQGQLVECAKDEYENGLRSAIQDQAGKWIDQGDSLRGMIALEEVKRLDKKFSEAA